MGCMLAEMQIREEIIGSKERRINQSDLSWWFLVDVLLFSFVHSCFGSVC